MFIHLEHINIKRYVRVKNNSNKHYIPLKWSCNYNGIVDSLQVPVLYKHII